ncbi:MAG: mannose-1-phosphate guanylyltransferase [Candidatus Moranbacteria bacterium]|nr:mannose-1-phosphate guanylyltransferase [Candidatus Moranbacteria bacterium]
METSESNTAIVIMAGGSGTRLWPLSRKNSPKQFQSFVSDKTLLEETYERAKRIVPEERIFISSGENYRNRILDLIPGMSDDRLLLEPSAQGTGPAIGLIATILGDRLPGVILATIASDHAIENEAEFVSSIRAGIDAVSRNRNRLAVIGIDPTAPDTGLGYIKVGSALPDAGPVKTFYVDSFKEKPDRKTAETYLSDGGYLWNAGYFIFSTDVMLEWIDEYVPRLSKILTAIGNGSPINQAYAEANNEPIDTMLVERLPSESRIVIPAPIQWSDIGTWNSLFDFLSRHGEEKSFLFGDALEVDGSGNLVYSKGGKKVIALFGVDDLVVVDTDDALLVTSRERAADIKKLISELKDRGREDLL